MDENRRKIFTFKREAYSLHSYENEQKTFRSYKQPILTPGDFDYPIFVKCDQQPLI